MFGYLLPRNYMEAIQFDKESKNCKWCDAIKLEIQSMQSCKVFEKWDKAILDKHKKSSMDLRGILGNPKIVHTMHTMRTTCLRCLSSHAFYDFVDRAVHRVNAPHAPLNQCEPWREVGGSSQTNKMTDEPSDVSKVASNTSDVPEQVPGKKQDAARNKMLAFWKNSRHQVLRTSSLMKRRHKF